MLDQILSIAESDPDRAAIDYSGRVTSYGALAEHVDEVAGFLTSAGIGPGALVGHAFGRHPGALVALLGILRSGAGYVPIDPRYPADRVSFTLGDAEVSCVLADSVGAEAIRDLGLPTAILDGTRLPSEAPSPVEGRTIQGAAYVIYTSGSTGRPKGVAVGREALTAYVGALNERLEIASGDRYLHTASFSFSSSVRQLFLPLSAGATVVLADRTHIADARALLSLVKGSGVTVVDLVPSYLAGCIRALREEDAGPRRELLDNDLRLVLTASEPLPSAVVEAWRDDLGHGADMVNMFGQTETAGIVSTWDVPREGLETGIVPIGRPIPGVSLEVVDEGGKSVSPGETGELVVRGPTLGLGYVGLDEATRERFGEPGDRRYRSGDLARVRADGALDFLGRRDTQVKVRGHRVELEEVEARLVGHPDVREAAALVADGPDGQPHLVAVIAPAAGATVDARGVRRFVAAALPTYMVPGVVRVTAALPRTPNGKLDRGALAELDAERLELSIDYVAPRNEDEQLVADVWQSMLMIDRVGVYDDFFELGGHSLLAMRVMARLRTATDAALPVRLLFEHPTVADLAGMIGSVAGASTRPPLEPRAGDAQVRPSLAQKRLWLLHQLDAESTAYNLVAAVRLLGDLDRSALERAVTEIVRRHDALRTSFPSVAGEPSAVVAEPYEVSLETTQVDTEEALVMALESEAGRPYDLESGPLLRTGLFRRGEREHVLLIGMHHIVSDGWSRGVLYDELAQLYQAFASSSDSPLPELSVQYGDYADWQERWIAADGLGDQEAWWKEQLAGCPSATELPAQRPRPAIQTFAGNTVTFPISPALVDEVRRLGGEEKASPFMVYLAALASVTGRYARQHDVVIGSPTAGRADPATEALIGFFVNTLALRLDLGEAPTFRELVRQARTTSLGAFANQDLPFDRVVDALDLPRDLSRSPLFQVMLILQNTPPATHQPAGLAMSQVDVFVGSSMYDVTLSLVAGESGMTGRIEYNTDLFDEEFMRRFGGHFVNLLEAGVQSPEVPVSELALLSPSEEEELFALWNDTETAVDSATIHSLFEDRVAEMPDETALIFGEERLSYSELDRRATQLARHLVQSGVTEETLIGICVSRSVQMVVGLLGILKAGATYVPLDPTYPRDRLAHMISDSGCPIVLTESKLGRHLPSGRARTIELDREWPAIEAASGVPLPSVPDSAAAYCIYTSGSTGKPKGVVVEHRNVVNFFRGMDDRVATGQPIVWLAVTSISFDISVLELFWTLARGATVVVQADEPQAVHGAPQQVSTRPIDFSLFYFASDAVGENEDAYGMLLKGARFADENGFSAVWVPERHFHDFGGIYPSPAVLGGALATMTENIKLRSGSVVLPLHDTIRVAEDWSVVDNLSGGRVQLSFASGWHDRDFVFQPQNYSDRRSVMMGQIEELRSLWRGESITRSGGEGTPHEVTTYPRPVQPELPIFVTAAGTPETYVRAGRSGAHLLTHLLGQSVEQLEEKIRSYRAAWDEAGHEGRGVVALMMHTFVGEDLEEVRELVRGPFREYLRSSVGLISGLAKGRGQDLRSADFTDEDMEALLDHAFDRYFQTSALMGTPESCLATIERLKALDVDDVACLIDFGIPQERVLESLELLAQLHRTANPADAPEDDQEVVGVPVQIERHGVTHLQCTPSYAEILLEQPGGPEALEKLSVMMVGGEALPLSLARRLTETVDGSVLNMYGPTETTIWSTTERVSADEDAVSLGRPIANTELFVVDSAGHPVPVGVPGELLIGGRGVVRGYWQRPELTAERFVALPSKPGARVYRTGDLVKYRSDGRLDFLGRLDHQVKVRGHRIELGEIETLLRATPSVKESVVVAREDVPGDKRLVGYVVLEEELEDAENALRAELRKTLPEWMVPQHVVVLDQVPLTPNGKTNRAALPAPTATVSTEGFVAPTSDIEQTLADVWSEVLRRPSVGVRDNFFDLGGHSLLTVRVQAALKERLGRVVPITDLFRYPTIRTLAERLSEPAGDDGKAVTDAASERAQARRGAMARRRARS